MYFFCNSTNLLRARCQGVINIHVCSPVLTCAHLCSQMLTIVRLIDGSKTGIAEHYMAHMKVTGRKNTDLYCG